MVPGGCISSSLYVHSRFVRVSRLCHSLCVSVPMCSSAIYLGFILLLSPHISHREFPMLSPSVSFPKCSPSICILYPRVFSKRPSWCVSSAMFSPDIYTRYIHLLSLRTSHSVIPMHPPSVSFPVCSPSISPGISVLYHRISIRVFPIDSPCASFVTCSFGISPGISILYSLLYSSVCSPCISLVFPSLCALILTTPVHLPLGSPYFPCSPN